MSFSFIFLKFPCSVPLSSYSSTCMFPCVVCVCLSSVFTYAKPLVCRQCILIATAELDTCSKNWLIKILFILIHSLVMGLPHSISSTLYLWCVVYLCTVVQSTPLYGPPCPNDSWSALSVRNVSSACVCQDGLPADDRVRVSPVLDMSSYWGCHVK